MKLDKNIVRILERDLIKEIKENKPQRTILDTAYYLRLAYKSAEENNESYKGHQRLFENVFKDYIIGNLNKYKVV